VKDIRQKLLATFQIEHRDHVDQIRSLMAVLETGNGKPPGAELDEVFRRAHSLKGAARAVDVRPVEGLAHRLETLFSRVRQGVLLLDKGTVGVVEQALDAIEDTVAGLAENRPAPGFPAALGALERALGIEPAPAEVVPVPELSPVAFQAPATVRVTAQNFDGLLRSAGALLMEAQRHGQMSTQLAVIAKQASSVEEEVARARTSGPARVDGALASVEHQVRALSQQVNLVRRWHRHSAWALARMGQQLQKDVWQARMLPAETLVEGFRKMMRDLARDEAKEVEFRAVTGGVQADRGVLDGLKDPLMHALRNAVTHGIEVPKDRAAKGKPLAGLVSLRMEAEGQRLQVTIEDDGRGLDLDRIAAIAVRQGIISESEGAGCSPTELSRIVFRPGFTTSRVVTDLSGRGMGLSVVHEAARRLQGFADLRPRPGGGTILDLSVPLSISTHRLLFVSCCGEMFAIPMHAIERLQRASVESTESVEGKPVVRLKDERVPLFALRHLLGLGLSAPRRSRFMGADAGQEHTASWHEPRPLGSGQGLPDALHVIILRSNHLGVNQGRVAVAVDAFVREGDAVIQDLGPAAPKHGKISGGAVLEDGSVVFVVNPAELLAQSSSAEQPPFLKPARVIEKKPASILVVDDSMTTRALEKSILEAHGYRVRVAVDGMDALRQLQSELPDLVIADIQMPHLDGYGLLEAMKKDDRLRRIPVIMVSSLERPEDQERGLALGADAYIVKRKFDQGELLATIRQIL
jgi:two-component system, chemotaxis family, sensor kinase CheA